MNPSSKDKPVTAVKRVPTSRKGYLSRLVIKIKPKRENPNLAPAVVEDIKCDPPIAAPARIIPGPRLFILILLK